MLFPTYRPQRWYPRYNPALEFASRVPGGLALASAALMPIGKDMSPRDDVLPTGTSAEHLHYVIASFPRTGTTFLNASLLSAGLEPDEVWKTHNVFDIGRALRDGNSVVVTVREPLAAALSWSIYNNDPHQPAALRRRFDAYTAWYRQALRECAGQPVLIVPFTQVTEHPDEVVAALGIDGSEVTPQAIATVLDRIFDEEREAIEHAHLPSPDRAALARQHAALLTHPSVRRAYRRADRVYRYMQSRMSDDAFRLPWLTAPTVIASTAALGGGAVGAAIGLSRAL